MYTLACNNNLFGLQSLFSKAAIKKIKRREQITMETDNVTLDDVIFSLEKRDVFVDLGNHKLDKIPGKKAIINANTKKPISIIGNDYEIITNKEAYEYGIQCMKTLFKLNGNDGIELFNIISPETRSFCHIDLFIKDKDFVTLEEHYRPFVRVTNSYNRMFKLSFKIGVCRNICKNGMIFNSEAISFNYSHVKGAREKVNFKIKADEFERILNKFKSDMEIIREKTFPAEYSFLIFCKALDLTFDLSNVDELKSARETERLTSYRNIFNNKLDKYEKELGSNYYAIYNVITDIGTHGFDNDKLFATRVNSRQAKAGIWLDQITEMLRKENINYEVYLKDYLELF